MPASPGRKTLGTFGLLGIAAALGRAARLGDSEPSYALTGNIYTAPIVVTDELAPGARTGDTAQAADVPSVSFPPAPESGGGDGSEGGAGDGSGTGGDGGGSGGGGSDGGASSGDGGGTGGGTDGADA